jgi:hypothetical protein
VCADADDAKARALQLAITARVRGLRACVNGAIDLDDELDGRRQEIGDEEPSDGHLAAKRHAELASLECGPKRGIGLVPRPRRVERSSTGAARSVRLSRSPARCRRWRRACCDVQFKAGPHERRLA